MVTLLCRFTVFGRNAHIAVGWLFSASGILLFQYRKLTFYLAYLFGTFFKQLQFVCLELILCSFDRLEQEVAVVAAVLNHGRTLVRRHKHLFPKSTVLGQNCRLLCHQLLMQFCCFIHGFRLRCYQRGDFAFPVSVVFLSVSGCVTCNKAEYQQYECHHG